MFRQLTDTLWVSPQITVEDVSVAASQGITLIINNRPEGESEDQTPGEAIAAVAHAEGLDYVAIPVGQGGFSEPQLTAMRQALTGAKGGVLAYCRSGTRSTLLWTLAQAAEGVHPDELAAQAARAGYDVTPVRPIADMLYGRRG